MGNIADLFRSNPCPDYEAPKPPDFPRFCSRCGSALKPEVEPVGFDEKTGAPKFFYWLHCPRWTGTSEKVICREPFYFQRAAFLNATYTERRHQYSFDPSERDYLDCAPEASQAKAAARKPRPKS